MLGREIFDSQIQFLGDWRRSGGTKNRNKDLLSRRRFARQRIRKIRKTNDSRFGAFYCVEFCDCPKSAFPGTTDFPWEITDAKGVIQSLSCKRRIWPVEPRRVYSFSVAGLEKREKGHNTLAERLRCLGAWVAERLREVQSFWLFL